MTTLLFLVLTLPSVADERIIYFPNGQHAKTLDFLIASASRQQDLRRTKLVSIGDGFYTLSLSSNLWGQQQWLTVMESYPYGPPNSLYVNGDWLIAQLSDASESDAYYLLLFGRVPVDEEDYYKLLGLNVAESRKYSVGMIETDSRVVLSKVRRLEFMPALTGYATVSRDYIDIGANNTPFESVLGHDEPSDASEYINSIPKVWGGGRGNLQVYYLSNAQRKTITEASVKVARDLTNGGKGFRSISSIRVPGSCMSCHAEGLNTPSVNGLKVFAEAGVEIFSENYEVERFHFTDLTKTIRRANEDFAETLMQLNGLTPSENIEQLHAALSDYDKPLTLEDVAVELGMDAAVLQLAIGYSSEKGLVRHPSIIGLGHKIHISRKAYEQLYFEIRVAVETWLSESGKRTIQSNVDGGPYTSCWPQHLQAQSAQASVTLGIPFSKSESLNQQRSTGAVSDSGSLQSPRPSQSSSSRSSSNGASSRRRRRRR